MSEKKPEVFSKYERARIIGARGLQLAMDAPLLIDISEKELEELNYDSLKLAEKELDSNVLPITVRRPLPMRNESELKVALSETINKKVSDEVTQKIEETIEKEITEEGEIMELANTEEDFEEESSGAGDLEE